MTFKSMDEFLRYYYPKRIDEEGGMTPEEFGEYLAKEHLKKIREALKKSITTATLLKSGYKENK